jgi:RNA polymerase sigma factor (sigma-70 family)
VTRREVLWDYARNEAVGTSVANNRPYTPIEALMQCAPGQEPDLSQSELLHLRDILQDAIETLDADERAVFDACTSSRRSLRNIATELGYSKSGIAVIRDRAANKLQLALQHNPTIKEYLNR